MDRSMTVGKFLVAGVFVALVAGCFDEPTPAEQTVAKEARVYLSEKGLKDLSSVTFAAADKMDYLNLDRNELTNVNEVASIKGLKWLRLNNNQLSKLPQLSGLTKLRRIYLKNNRFDKVPEELKDLPDLTDIDLSGNPITEIPDWLAKKEGLENLSFSRTQITKLPEDLTAWKNLLSLQLGDLKLSAAEMARIRAALPGVAIIF